MQCDRMNRRSKSLTRSLLVLSTNLIDPRSLRRGIRIILHIDFPCVTTLDSPIPKETAWRRLEDVRERLSDDLTASLKRLHSPSTRCLGSASECSLLTVINMAWIVKTRRESTHSKNLERRPQESRQTSRTDRGVGHHISTVCRRVQRGAYMLARLCFGQLSITGKNNRVCAQRSRKMGEHLNQCSINTASRY